MREVSDRSNDLTLFMHACAPAPLRRVVGMRYGIKQHAIVLFAVKPEGKSIL